MKSAKNKRILILSVTILGILMVSYSNHFTNGFYFDDAHVINSNGAIRDISNIPSFFSDPTTFSSQPANQAYRPMVTVLDAIDYWMAGGELNPVYFHAHIFFWYIVQCVLMFFLFRKIIQTSIKHKWGDYIALIAVGWYALHTANAETINYISARSDSFSTLCVVAGLLMYQVNKTRKLYLYLIPMLIGVMTKQSAVMAYPLLFLYIYFFETEEESPLQGMLDALKKSAAAGVFIVGLFLFNQLYMTPASTVSSNTTVTIVQYFSTQWYVMTIYLGNFFLPIGLSADPDVEIITEWLNFKKLWGLIVVSTMLIISFASYRRKSTRPISYGILWFFVALLPTSSFVPLYQIANDHRTFFPYIGLAFALVHGLALLVLRWESEISKDRLRQGLVLGAAFLVFSGYGYGAYQRNKVWSSVDTLWYDVTIKSPKSIRGQMNYGNTLMGKGKYKEAREYFERTLELAPRYSYVHINMGILLGALGETEKAEEYFNNGIIYGRSNPEAFFFFGNWLMKSQRYEEARKMFETALSLSPQHTKSQVALEKVRDIVDENWAKELGAAIELAENYPTYENILNLSRSYYRMRNWEKCISVARDAIEIYPEGASAYNNICTALIHLGRYDEAIENCGLALEIVPSFQLAKNNLNWAKQMKSKEGN